MVTIRLARKGTTKRPVYRIVVADSRRSRGGKFLEVVGTYDPMNLQVPADSSQKQEKGLVNLKSDRVLFWIAKGAKPSETVLRILNGQKIFSKKAA